MSTTNEVRIAHLIAVGRHVSSTDNLNEIEAKINRMFPELMPRVRAMMRSAARQNSFEAMAIQTGETWKQWHQRMANAYLAVKKHKFSFGASS